MGARIKLDLQVRRDIQRIRETPSEQQRARSHLVINRPKKRKRNKGKPEMRPSRNGSRTKNERDGSGKGRVESIGREKAGPPVALPLMEVKWEQEERALDSIL